jgi:hypothetical protein
MTARGATVHRLASGHDLHWRTFCGLEGWRARHCRTEFDKIDGGRFEAVAGPAGVTCRKCRKNAEVRGAT